MTDVSWGFFFVASLLLNFVTLNLLLAMCVSPISSILSPLDNADGLVEDLYAQTIPVVP